MDDYKLLFYGYGDFAATTMMRGILHPDMHRGNIGVSEQGYRFVDYADVKQFSMPEGLTTDVIRQLTESLFPLVDGTEQSFLNCSYLRAGFLATGGMFAHELFNNTLNNGLSSAIYMKHPFATNKYEPEIGSEKTWPCIEEWKNTDVASINLGRYQSLEEYEGSEVRRHTSESNRYYLDLLYLSKACIFFMDKEELKIPYAITLLNMAILEMKKGKLYKEYGLLKKCLKVRSGMPQIEEQCKGRLFQMLPSWECNPDCVDYIDQIIDELDLFEFLWVLDDIELYNK